MPRPTTKESIIEYCKEDGIDCIDTSSKNPHHEWSLNLNKVIIYCQKKYPHRIYVQVNISFGELVPIFNTKENKGKLMTLLKMFALSNVLESEFLIHTHQVYNQGNKLYQTSNPIWQTSLQNFCSCLCPYCDAIYAFPGR